MTTTTPHAKQLLIDAIKAHLRAGWPIFPLHGVVDGQCTCGTECHSPGKHPRTPNGVKDATTDKDTIKHWLAQYGATMNIGGACTGRLVIDVDTRSGGQWPAPTDPMLPPTRRHLSGRGEGGHLIYRLPEGDQGDDIKPYGITSKAGGYAPGMDVKCGPRAYVVLPPSVHIATGRRYAADETPEVEAPRALIDELSVATGIVQTIRSERGGLQLGAVAQKALTSGVGELLNDLRDNPPTQGGRHDWLVKVCGHIAALHRDTPDLYEPTARDYAAKITPPLPDAEVDKIITDIGNKEAIKYTAVKREATHLTGYLVSSGEGTLLTPVQVDDGYRLAETADFDVIVQNKIMRDDGTRAYDVEVYRRDRRAYGGLVESAVFGDARSFNGWLAKFAASFEALAKVPTRLTPQARVLRYIDSQDAPTITQAPVQGWRLTPEGYSAEYVLADTTIAPDGPHDYGAACVVESTMQNSPRYHYGFSADRHTALNLIREAMTYQADDVASVFTSWMMASLLKPHIKRTGLFPICAVEAVSGTGKTSGFFGIMTRLCGLVAGEEGGYTPASLRDALTTHNAAPVWVDDVNHPEHLQEILRQVAMGASMSKKDAEAKGTVKSRFVNPLLISGESLDMQSEKAIDERVVLLRPPSMRGRASTREGAPRGRLQYDDLREFTGRLDALGEHGASEVAGHLIHALAELVEEGLIIAARDTLTHMKGLPEGRGGEKATVLLIGAYVLDTLLGDDVHFDRVFAWVETNCAEAFAGDDNATKVVIPWALSDRGFPNHPYGGAFVRNPCFIDDEGTVWTNTKLLDEAWRREPSHRGDTRIAGYRAIGAQLAAINGASLSEVGRNFETERPDQLPPGQAAKAKRATRDTRRRYVPLPPEVSALVIDRARGVSE